MRRIAKNRFKSMKLQMSIADTKKMMAKRKKMTMNMTKRKVTTTKQLQMIWKNMTMGWKILIMKMMTMKTVQLTVLVTKIPESKIVLHQNFKKV